MSDPLAPITGCGSGKKGRKGADEETPLTTTGGHQGGTILPGLSQEQSGRGYLARVRDFAEVMFENIHRASEICRA